MATLMAERHMKDERGCLVARCYSVSTHLWAYFCVTRTSVLLGCVMVFVWLTYYLKQEIHESKTFFSCHETNVTSYHNERV